MKTNITENTLLTLQNFVMMIDDKFESNVYGDINQRTNLIREIDSNFHQIDHSLIQLSNNNSESGMVPIRIVRDVIEQLSVMQFSDDVIIFLNENADFLQGGLNPSPIDILKIWESLKSKDFDTNKPKRVEPLFSKYDRCFINVAENVAMLSKDPSTKIGAVITGEHNQIISQGFNGFPRGVEDTTERYNEKETKYQFVVHAEANAIYNALKNGANKLEGSTIYVHGLPCCNECAKAIIQVGIKRVVYKNTKEPSKKWSDSKDISTIMFKESGVTVEEFKE